MNDSDNGKSIMMKNSWIRVVKRLNVGRFVFSFAIVAWILSFRTANLKAQLNDTGTSSMAKVFAEYYEGRLKLYPIEATYAGDDRYNDQLRNRGLFRSRNWRCI